MIKIVNAFKNLPFIRTLAPYGNVLQQNEHRYAQLSLHFLKQIII